jgi:SAM-dependent methyltransferase
MPIVEGQQVDADRAAWNDAMYRKHPTPYAQGIAGRIQRARVAAVLDLARVGPDDRVLEIGCERGELLCRVPSCSRLVGCDISRAALEDAAALLAAGGKDAELYHADAESSLPFARGEFSVIVCSEVLEHVPGPGRVVRNIRALCEPGTRVVLTVPFEAPKLKVKAALRKAGLLNLLFPRIEADQSEWHLHGFSDRMLRDLVTGTFEVDRARAVWFCHGVYLCRPVP